MAQSKIKKRTGSAKASPLPRQNAVPCLIIVVLILLVVGVLLYLSLRATG
jgi:hypothetical protein